MLGCAFMALKLNKKAENLASTGTSKPREVETATIHTNSKRKQLFICCNDDTISLPTTSPSIFDSINYLDQEKLLSSRTLRIK